MKILVRLYYEMWEDGTEGLKNGPYTLKEGQIFSSFYLGTIF